MVGVGGSPMPLGGSSLATMCASITGGASVMRSMR